MSSILRLPQVVARTGLSRSSIYLHMSKGKFPKHFKLGERASGWLESEIEEWIKERAVKSRAETSDDRNAA